MQPESDVRRRLLKQAVELLPKRKRQQGWELAAILDANKLQLSDDGEFIPEDDEGKPIRNSHINHLLRNTLKLLNIPLQIYSSVY